METVQTSAVMLKNSHCFSHDELSNYTRRIAFEGKVPKTRSIKTNYTIVSSCSSTSVEFIDPLKEKTIPSTSDLKKWSTELKKAHTGSFIQFNEGGKIVNFNQNTIKTAEQLHAIRDCKDCVERELAFFSSSRNIPRCIVKPIDVEAMTSFRELVHNSGSSNVLEDFDMLPGELARLCGRRYLSDQHMMWIADNLNNMQPFAHVVFANFITNVEEYCQRKEEEDNFCPNLSIECRLNRVWGCFHC